VFEPQRPLSSIVDIPDKQFSKDQRVDFALEIPYGDARTGFILEMDGRRFHSNIFSRLNDERRDKMALQGGWDTYRIEQLNNMAFMNNWETDAASVKYLATLKANYGKKALCVNGSGPVANDCTVQFLLDEIAKINADDIVIISGSVMHGFPDDFVTALAQAVHQRNAKVVIDMEQITMEQLKECRPYLIKPNLYEFQLLFENDEINESNIDEYLKKANEIGIENILVSLGKDGAVLSNAHGIFRLDQPRTVLVNKVGAGDAMLASFIGKLSQGYSSEEALQWGGAAGNATASKIEDITMRDIEGYLLQMKVKKVEE
jgi:fructose-1-phosphate kinase PfkB-like protein